MGGLGQTRRWAERSTQNYNLIKWHKARNLMQSVGNSENRNPDNFANLPDRFLRQLLPCHIQETQQSPFAAQLVHAIEEPLQATEVSLSFNRHEFRFSFSPGIAPEQGDSGGRLGRVTSANQLQTCAFQQFFVFTGERKSNDRSRYALRFPRARPFRPRSAHR